MQKELFYIFAPPVGWILYSAGGYRWKGWRRFILPLFVGVITLINGVDIYRSFITAALLCASFTLGYSDKYNDTRDWLWRLFVGLCYAISLVPVGFSWFLLTIPATFLLTFWLSRKHNWFTFKIAEGLTGLILMINLLLLI